MFLCNGDKIVNYVKLIIVFLLILNFKIYIVCVFVFLLLFFYCSDGNKVNFVVVKIRFYSL